MGPQLGQVDSLPADLVEQRRHHAMELGDVHEHAARFGTHGPHAVHTLDW